MKKQTADLIALWLYLKHAEQLDSLDFNNETALVRPTQLFIFAFLLALCAGCWSVALVDLVPDAGAKGVVAVGGQQSSRSGQEAEVVVENVTLLNAVLEEEAVAQSVIAHCVLHLREKNRRKKNLQCGQKNCI